MSDIDNMRQNHPELVVRDLAPYVACDITRRVLKNRGVNKWLRVRRLLIKMKISWAETLGVLDQQARDAKAAGNHRRYHRLRGQIKGVTNCRQQVRSLCHSPRDVDFPKNPRDFGEPCELPKLPERPHKRWFWRHDGYKGRGAQRTQP